ncbi:hypothetical protein LOTGIDRAFT_237959 [Lottia gigantea]|uniref:Uncharacterized protein n=1 Tax=Lottia gigantea TaxID=225164 RepID=V4CJS6_LOTGI|nr:hypothetical protein LOTGIDRAFT_237959 [Lottia gigantea]ESP02455.1 hypothetical protein LOTGIDRAFT_237959 [Lottia gigantea]
MGRIRIFVLAVCFLIFIPYIHIGVIHLKIWARDKTPVNETKCRCSCFDTVLRGSYENPGENVKYKSVYVNATRETFMIWTVTVLFMLAFYESVQYLCRVFISGKTRIPMFLLFLANFYPQYYSWFSLFNYFNERFYSLFFNHTFFILTELIVSAVVLNLFNAENHLTSRKILTLVTISSIHIMVNATDQFIDQVIYGHGKLFQNARNLGLMIPDILHLVISLFVFRKHVSRNGKKMSEVFSTKDILMCVSLVVFGTIFGIML